MSKINRLAKNIKNLRRGHKETQRELAKALGVSHNTISGYEKEGGSEPSVQMLCLLAEHYGVTVDHLIFGLSPEVDYTDTPSMKWADLIEVLDLQFPLICTDNALKNQHFSNGYKLTQEIREVLANPYSDIPRIKIKQAIVEYEKTLAERPEIVEAAANLLWLFFICFSLFDEKGSVKIGEAIAQGKAQKPDFMKKYFLRNLDQIHETSNIDRQEFVRENQSEVMKLIRRLKGSTEYADLADYYMALRYIMDAVYNGESEETNTVIGMEMFAAFGDLGNKYVINMLKVWGIS